RCDDNSHFSQQHCFYEGNQQATNVAAVSAGENSGWIPVGLCTDLRATEQVKFLQIQAWIEAVKRQQLASSEKLRGEERLARRAASAAAVPTKKKAPTQATSLYPFGLEAGSLAMARGCTPSRRPSGWFNFERRNS